MRAAHRNALHAALAAAAGVAGVTLARCSGGACSACLACAIPGASVVLLTLASARRGAARHADPSQLPPARRERDDPVHLTGKAQNTS